MSHHGLYDPTTIMNADELNYAMREGWIKLAFYLISFFVYLYMYELSRRISLRWMLGSQYETNND